MDYSSADPKPSRRETFGGYDFSKPSRIVLALNSLSQGVVMWAVGGHWAVMYETTQSTTAEENGLDFLVDAGIWIWEGVLTGGQRQDGPDGYDYADLELEGSLREPTAEEWQAIQAGRCPWNDEDWKLRG